MKRKLFVVSMLIVLVGAAVAWGEPIAREIYYQKKTNLAYPNTYTFRFSLWDTGIVDTGAKVWEEEKPVTITSALIKTYLGDDTPLDPAQFSKQLWVQVERKKGASYVRIGARDKLRASPYALNAGAGPGFVSVSAMSGIPRSTAYETHQSAGTGWIGRRGVMGSDYLTSPIQLPHSVTITSFSLTCYDADAVENCDAYLWRDDDLRLATVSTTGSAGLQTVTTTDINEPVVDNSLHAYYVYFYVTSANVTAVKAVVGYQ